MDRKSDRTPLSKDPTPIAGVETDTARLGRTGSVPPHERTADQDSDPVDWERVAASEGFKRLIAAKRAFIIPATVFFVLYYFALPILVGYAPDLMRTRIFGVLNLAYLFALSQFFMAWILAALYLRAARRFDRMSRELIAGLPYRGGQ